MEAKREWLDTMRSHMQERGSGLKGRAALTELERADMEEFVESIRSLLLSLDTEHKETSLIDPFCNGLERSITRIFKALRRDTDYLLTQEDFALILEEYKKAIAFILRNS